ncbi:MAG: hypothetical protein ACRDQ4_10845 [Pseudonocardiaceae bacterium]
MGACPNVAFRRARRTRALTQAQLAAKAAELVEQATERGCGIDADYISKIERGAIRWPSAAYRAAFRTLLGATSDADLGLYCPRSTEATLIVASALTAPAIVGGEPTWVEDAMIDRDLSSYASAATIGALSAYLPDLLRGALRRTVVPARIEEHHVEQLKQIVEFFDSSDCLFGGGMSRNAATGQLEWCYEVLAKSSMSDEVRRAWQLSTARLAGKAGHICFDCGDHIAARRLFLVSLQLAGAAGDVQERASTLFDAAHQAIRLGRYELSLDLVRLARGEDRRLSPVAQAILTTVEAQALGHQGEVAAVERAVGQADDLFAQRAAEPDHPAWTWFYSDAQMTCEGGRALFDAAMHAGDARIATMAEHRLQSSYDLSPADRARSRSFDLIRVACLVLRFDDPHHGLALAEQALDTAASLRSTRIAEDVRMLAKTAAPLERDPAFRPRARELRHVAQRVAQAVG